MEHFRHLKPTSDAGSQNVPLIDEGNNSDHIADIGKMV